MKTIHILSLFFLAAALCAVPACTTTSKKDSPKTLNTYSLMDNAALSGLEGVWEDQETRDIHTIKKTVEGFTVLSVIEYGEGGELTETMDVKSSSFENGILSWSYDVPSTGYTVFFSTVELNGDDLLINWSNTDNAGGTRSGQETLHRVLGKTDADTISILENDNGSDNTFGGRIFGKVYKISSDEIIVACKDINNETAEGEILYIIIDGEKIELSVILAAQSVIRCRLSEKDQEMKDQIEINMPVYK